MAKFKHPGIVAVHDAGETPSGLLYFIMEFIEGTTLNVTVKATDADAPTNTLTFALAHPVRPMS